MTKPKKPNTKKMKRIKEKDEKRIIAMRKAGFSLRQIGRALHLTHPAIWYFLKIKNIN